ncbi:MAG: LysR family transcriptional regulator [Pseudobdellovibrionaceae bacterium]
MITYPNLYYLKYFVDAVELESISGAAQRNRVSHPAISRAISNLEKHLEVELLEHRKKSFKVTEAGYKVAKQAKSLLSSVSEFNSLSLGAADEEPVHFSLGLSKSLSFYYLGGLLNDIRSQFSQIKVHVSFGTTAEITEAVAKRKIDVGITIGTQKLPTLKQNIIKTGKFQLIEAKANRSLRETWESKSFIMTEPRFETEFLKLEYQKQFGRQLPVSFEVKSWQVISELVQEGLGVGLVPDLTIKSWNKESFRVLRPSWFDCEYEVYAHSLKRLSSPPIVQFAIDWLLQKD